MTTQIINGKEFANQIKQQITTQTAHIKQQHNLIPTLAVILVGLDPASQIYVNAKKKAAKACGMNSLEFTFDNSITQDDLLKQIKQLNQDKNVNGILVQLPLPPHIDKTVIINSIDHTKDVDGFHYINAGKLLLNQVDEDTIIPCTPLGCIQLICNQLGDDLAGKKAVIIGSSNIVGRPMAALLANRRATILLANSKTPNLKSETLTADIIIACAGVPNLITKNMVKKGAIIIDVGINRVKNQDGGDKIIGDVDFENIVNIAGAITPVPGGVGPMTIANLLANNLKLFKSQHKLK